MKTFLLIIISKPFPFQMTNGVTSGTSTPNNAASSSGAEENLEPSAKRRKVLRGSAPHPTQSGQQLNGDEDGGLPWLRAVRWGRIGHRIR